MIENGYIQITQGFPVIKAFQNGEHYFELHLAAEGFSAVPGQFVHVKCGDGLLLRRPISICDVSKGTLRLVFEVKGDGTKWLSKRVDGDIIDLLGPLGNSFTKADSFTKTDGSVLLAAGGIGAAPLLFAASKNCDAVLGFRSKERALLLDEFAARCGGVDIATDDGSLGEKCYVAELVSRKLKERKYSRILACGPEIMLKTVAKVAGDIPCELSLEQRMGCGVGACLVCAVKNKNGGYSRVCRDGPVFMASEVDFND